MTVSVLDAPEAHRSFRDFAMACRPSLKEAWASAKEGGCAPAFDTPKAWFDYCWSQPEAEMLHWSFMKPEALSAEDVKALQDLDEPYIAAWNERNKVKA